MQLLLRSALHSLLPNSFSEAINYNKVKLHQDICLEEVSPHFQAKTKIILFSKSMPGFKPTYDVFLHIITQVFVHGFGMGVFP